MSYNGLVALDRRRYGILPGAFNPPTEAHLALARAALTVVDHVIFVLPRTMPHKDYSGVSFKQRLELLRQVTAEDSRFFVAHTAGGLFIEIARELRSVLPEGAQLHFLCGRDAAERIVNWRYETPEAFGQMLTEFSLLVAPRDGDYLIPERHAASIANIPLAPAYQVMSATEVRRHISEGRHWEHLVPFSIREHVRLLYASGAESKTP